jgi:hypothetical protein
MTKRLRGATPIAEADAMVMDEHARDIRRCFINACAQCLILRSKFSTLVGIVSPKPAGGEQDVMKVRAMRHTVGHRP